MGNGISLINPVRNCDPCSTVGRADSINWESGRYDYLFDI